jgi:hypothetical protein
MLCSYGLMVRLFERIDNPRELERGDGDANSLVTAVSSKLKRDVVFVDMGVDDALKAGEA